VFAVDITATSVALTQAGLTTATTMYRETDMTYWLERGEAEMKEWEPRHRAADG